MRKRENSSSVLLRWVPLVVLSKSRVRVIGGLMQSWCDMRVRFCAPPCLATMCLINPLYILPSLPLSLRALMSCSPIHVIYEFFSEKTSMPNMSCGNSVTAFNIHFRRPHIVLCRAITFLSSFLMAGSEYGTT